MLSMQYGSQQMQKPDYGGAHCRKKRPLRNALRGRCQYLAFQTGSEYSLFVCKGIQEVCHFFLGYSTDHIEIVILVHKGIRIALTVFVE